jgi:serine/threonine protein kinase
MSASADRGFEFSGTARFEVLRCLGAGGMGVVYEAFDRERQTRVALKTLRSLSADGLLRFKREFRDFLDLAHPNLISLGELFSEGRDWFFTMELVDGASFLEWVRPPPAAGPASFASISQTGKTVAEFTPRLRDGLMPPLKLERLRGALGQLVEGVMALHAAGKVHRDIKPSNVLVSPAGRLVLLDFGLAIEARREEQLLSTDVVGTVEYMAPEQAAARPVGPPTDWYAVGVMLYEALTGELPFSGPPLEVLMNKQRQEPAPPSLLQPSTAPEIDRLVVDLLRFDPDRRPNGPEILRRLGLAAGPIDHDASRASFTSTPPFIGRAEELVELRAAYEASRSGAVTVHVQGESGVGKSALVRRFTEMLKIEVPDAVILGGACYERESVPYKAVDGLIDALSRYLARLDKAEAASVLPRQAALLSSVFPVLARVEPFADAPRGPEVRDPHELRSRLFGALRELFARLGDRKPLVLTIDDLQWADADSSALLAEVLRPPESPALLLVATVRDRSGAGEPSGPHALNPSSGAEVRRLSLSRMSTDEARELAQLLISRAAGRSHIDARAVALEAGGHPLFIDELIRHSETGQGPAMHLEDALWARISRLDVAARRVLELTALAGGRLGQAAAAQAADLDPAKFGEQVRLLRVAHLVRTTGMRDSDYIEPYHDRVRAAVLSHVEPGRLRAQHRRLALALEASSHADPEALALHWREAGERARAAGYAAQAAAKAVRALAFDRAAELWGDCLALGLHKDADGRDLAVRRADALANAGRGSEAASAYLEAAMSATPSDALDLRRRAAEQLLRSGHVDEGLATLRTVLAAVDLRMADTPARALASLVLRRARIRLRGLRWKERDESQLSAALLRRIDTCWSAAAGLSMVDLIRSADFQARHMLLALDAGEPYRIARALAMEAGLASTAGRSAAARAQRLADAAAELAERIGHPYALAMAKIAAGVVAFELGRWREARIATELAEKLFRERCVGVEWEKTTAQLFRMSALFFLGELADLQVTLPALIQAADARGDLYTSVNLRIRQLNVARLAADDPAGARASADEAMRMWNPAAYLSQHYYHLVGMVSADLYEGRGTEAIARLRAGWRDVERSLFLRVQFIRIEATHLRGRAALMAAVGPDAALLRRAVLDDANRLDKEQMRWASALGNLLRAGLAAKEGDRAGADALLGLAIDELEALDMHLYAQAARRARGETAAVDAWMRRQNMRNPERMAQLLVPGFS